jgi:hypothetical protein
MHRTKQLWEAEEKLPQRERRIPPMDDFLCWDALQVRNTAQHPENMRFDPETGELVGDDRGSEIRWTEAKLRTILGALFRRNCQVMSLAIAKAAGAFDSGPDELRGEGRDRQAVLGMEVLAVWAASKAAPPTTEPVVELDDVGVLRPCVADGASHDVLETKQQRAVVVGLTF